MSVPLGSSHKRDWSNALIYLLLGKNSTKKCQREQHKRGGRLWLDLAPIKTSDLLSSGAKRAGQLGELWEEPSIISTHAWKHHSFDILRTWKIQNRLDVVGIVKELLYSKIVTSEEPLTCVWYKDHEIPAHTRCMMAGIKTLANWICARKNPTNVKIILSLVWLIQDDKDNWKDTNLGDADQARVRLSAGCALLKICEVPALWTCFSTALLSKLACIITDKVKQVRLGFALRLTRGLCREPGLPNDLLAFFPLSELSPDRQVCQQMREMLRKAIAAKRLRYRRLVLIEQVAMSTDQLINSHPHLLVEHSVGVAVFLLAFHPLFFAIDSWFDLYHVQCALETLLEALITAAPLRMDDKFYKDLFTSIHSSRNILVPHDEIANKKMWVACELGLSLLPNFPKGSGKVKTPEKFLLPVYFEPLSQTAWTDYIPTSLAKKLKSGKGGQRSATSSLEFSDLLEVQPPGDMRVDAEDEESEASEEMEEGKLSTVFTQTSNRPTSMSLLTSSQCSARMDKSEVETVYKKLDDAIMDKSEVETVYKKLDDAIMDKSEVETISKKLDDAIMEVLELMDELVKCKLMLEEITKSGFWNLAKARYIMGNSSVSALQLPSEGTDADIVALSTVYKSDDQFTLQTISPTKVKKTSTGELRKRTNNCIVNDEVREKVPDGYDVDQPELVDPVNWFGVLVPQNLRQAQSNFKSALELVVDSVNVQNRLKAAQAKSLKTSSLLTEYQPSKRTSLHICWSGLS
uniref:Vacuolar ATPase assembly protein VMA22 n=1 Tax=Timema monikensis TaxID=170555 RepID=A0A7R9EJR4_9NEOP|nr:unnamed protein product [Timema monikensis]